MRQIVVLFTCLAAFASPSARAQTLTMCTVVADATTGAMLKQEGDCARRVTPASTFKIALSLMGYDAGILKDAHEPALPFKKGYPAWRESWRSTTDPTKWMTESVVWYSHQITARLGEARFNDYVRAFNYGNRDVSGDPGANNGLTRSWIGSSLQISPLEQVSFLREIVQRKLPVSAGAFDMTQALVDIGPQPGGWHVYGKTGTAASRTANGKVAASTPWWGWFVGWATKDGRTVVFARLTKAPTRPAVSASLTAKESVLRDLFSSPDSF